MRNLKINTILNSIKTLSSILFPLITFPYISRVLLPENVGKVNFGSSYVSYFSLLATLGITTYAVRECSKVRGNKKELSNISSQIYSINICTTIVSYILLIITLCFFRNLDSYRTLIIIQSTVILFTTLGADWLNTAMEDFLYITVRTIIFEVISLILMFIFVRSPGDYLKYAAITVFSSSGANIMNIFYRKKYCDTHFITDINWQRHFKPIMFLFVMLLSQTIFNSADITMIGFIKGNYEVGLYSTSVKIVNIINQVISSILWVVLPRLSIYFEKKDYNNINSLLRNLFGLTLIVGLPCVAGVIAIAKEIILIVGGIEYINAVESLKILMFGLLFSLLGGNFIGNLILLPSKQEKYYMIVCCINAVFNIIANLFLIPLYGSNGAALSTAGSSILILILLVPKIDKSIHLGKINNLIFGPIIGSILIVLFCQIILNINYNLYLRTLICICGSIVIYLVVLIFTKNELVINTLSSMTKKIKNKFNF